MFAREILQADLNTYSCNSNRSYILTVWRSTAPWSPDPCQETTKSLHPKASVYSMFRRCWCSWKLCACIIISNGFQHWAYYTSKHSNDCGKFERWSSPLTWSKGIQNKIKDIADHHPLWVWQREARQPEPGLNMTFIQYEYYLRCDEASWLTMGF